VVVGIYFAPKGLKPVRATGIRRIKRRRNTSMTRQNTKREIRRSVTDMNESRSTNHRIRITNHKTNYRCWAKTG